jgi:hypothetical protein
LPYLKFQCSCGRRFGTNGSLTKHQEKCEAAAPMLRQKQDEHHVNGVRHAADVNDRAKDD